MISLMSKGQSERSR